jgi:hypothetical protein
MGVPDLFNFWKHLSGMFLICLIHDVIPYGSSWLIQLWTNILYGSFWMHGLGPKVILNGGVELFELLK